MKVYTVNSSEQAITIDQLKNAGCEVIQVSNGLLCKTSKSLEDIQKEVTGAQFAE